jgi:hypothetical protein
MKLTNQIDKANLCTEVAIIVLVGFLLTNRYVQLNQTVATYLWSSGPDITRICEQFGATIVSVSCENYAMHHATKRRHCNTLLKEP